jgi:diaminopimelate decarboxylase
MGTEKNFVVVDAGMNDLLRPTLYQAFHAIQPVVLKTDQKLTADVVGPICETSDFLARDREMVDVRNGDLLAVMSTGAYGFSMSSNYCSRARVAEVMVSEDRFYVIRARQDYEDLVVGETVPPFLEE